MTNYDYQCTECRRKFTDQQTFEEHDRGKRVTCPKCGSAKIERVMSAIFAKTSKKS